MGLRKEFRRSAAVAACSACLEELEQRRLLAVDFSIAAMSDTQYVVESFTNPSTFARQTNWVAARKSDPAYKFAFLAHQGDMLRRGYSDFQAGVAAEALQKLDTAAIPYAVAIGNHDYDNQFDDLDRHVSSANFAKHFGDARYLPHKAAQTISEYGSSLDQRNHYHVFSAGPRGQKFLVLSLEWQIPTAAQKWGQSVIDAHSQMPVILMTHEYLARTAGSRTTGTPVDAATIGAQNGESIYKNFVAPNPQIFMVLSGHTGATWNRVVTTPLNKTVYEIAADFESSKNDGGDGWLEAITFDLGDPLTRRLGSLTIKQVRPNPDGTQVLGPSNSYTKIDFAKRFTFAAKTPPAVVPVGASPVAAGQAVWTPEGKAVVIDPWATAGDADDEVSGLKPILTSLPARGAVYVKPNGTFEYTPDPDPKRGLASDSFEYVLSDGKSNSAPATVTVNFQAAAPVFSYPVAEPERPAAGTRTGSLADLTASDGVVETLTEVINSVGPDVDQRWTFDVKPGADPNDVQNVILAINAWRTFSNPGTGDEYHLTYSTALDPTWRDLTRIVPNSSKDVTRTRWDAGEPYQMWALPATISGTVYVRATDVNTSGTETVDSLMVDEIFIRSLGTVAAPATVAHEAEITAAAGPAGTFSALPVEATEVESVATAPAGVPTLARWARRTARKSWSDDSADEQEFYG